MAHQRLTVRGISLELELISLGNPHAVHFTKSSLADFPVSDIGRVLDLQVFQGGVNFEVARIVNRNCVEARVWEHGVGETLACGSGACAVAVAAYLKRATDNQVEVSLPGGPLSVEWDGRGEVFLTGPAQTVFQGEWADDEAGNVTASSPMKNEVLA
jgi:diaminopimelate epimerase